eukprot:TRINITY_DN6854_c0_g1_i1.p1 TRINITY_DN6854_c0_g1~~TRINITY_DN6854_c0_g1_i1.p1  ORF type:complete len:239 (-),score=67.76 TRINITY_DN6854_c0_g1_i1:196-912(-)
MDDVDSSSEAEAMRKLILVRHGETDFNKQQRVQGKGSDIPLNEEGITQASRLGVRLRAEKIDFVAVSPLKRAIQTAEKLLEEYKITNEEPVPPLFLHEGLMEMNMGELEGKVVSPTLDSPENMIKVVAELVMRWKNEEYDLCFPGGGESPLEAQRRATKAVEEILSIHAKEAKTILIVSHAAILQILLSSLLRLPLKKGDLFKQSNASLNVLTYNPESSSWSAETLNSSDHLSLSSST